ncbi:MAG TPA: nucleoside monophosphate kinase [Candidatus Saccharimonadales bacterium]|nr:nucleoside monophosphate kinase [Candidatus Saccharimonadales bacterium]
MGIAGSGKGTQGKMLADQQGLHLISMGDVLRMYVTGKQRDRMLKGELLDDEEIITIVDKVLSSMPDDEVLLDGFPRTVAQAKWLMDQVNAGRYSINIAFHLVASREAVKQRLLKRARIDDKEAAIEARFDEYERSTLPVLQWLGDHGVKVVDVNAERSVEDINAEIVENLNSARS